MVRIFIGLSFLVFFVITSTSGISAPYQVTLFPDSANVQVSVRAPVQGGGERLQAVVTLPGQAYPDTLKISLPERFPQKIIDHTWRSVTRQDDVRVAELRRLLHSVTAERNTLYAAAQSIDAQIQFWQTQAKARPKTLEEADAFAVVMGKNIKKGIQEKLQLEPQLRKSDDRMKELQAELQRTTGQKETLWEVTIFLNGPLVRELPLMLDYSLAGCGWTPAYRFDANPREKTVHFAWEAEVWQSSGSDWKGVDVRLATLPFRPSLVPPELPSWIIRPRLPVPASRPRANTELLKAHGSIAESVKETAEEPQLLQRSTYFLWQLGKREIAAGTKQRLRLREEIWPADFHHVIRPGVSGQAFLQASVHFPESREIPQGPALFFMEGALLGRRSAVINGREGKLFFGVDPLVKAEARLLSRQSGEKGFIADRQTQEWVWRYDVQNDRPETARVLVEDVQPQKRDERIKLFPKFDPAPAKISEGQVTWLLDLKAGEKAFLTTTISLEAPKDMDLDLGWRR